MLRAFQLSRPTAGRSLFRPPRHPRRIGVRFGAGPAPCGWDLLRQLTILHTFCSESNECTDGASPHAGLVQATNGVLYERTVGGGANGFRTIFEINGDTLTTLYSFDEFPYGSAPYATLLQGTDGDFYGTTYGGGAVVDEGTVFGLSVGLGPFVKTLPTSGKAGAAVEILGTDLTGATSVTFDGTTAVFRVVSGSEITTTVPADASSGTVRVAMPSGTLSSNVPFRVP
jgi:uncharacterized repeat protein (TIGR03803 family)